MYEFTSECVSPGHPDKVADIIADSIVQDIIKHDKNARIASEVFVAGNNIIVGGEVTTSYKPDYHKIIYDALDKIGYKDDSLFSDSEVLKPKNVKIQVLLNQQSSDINQGVDRENGDIGAGDQGIMFGFATNETPTFMPSALYYARKICDKVYNYALQPNTKIGIDIKTQVTIDYGTKENFEECLPQKISTIVVSAPSTSDMSIDEVQKLIKNLIDNTGLPSNLYNPKETTIYINPTGRYVNHSSLHDSGLTGRKLIVDSFGGYSPIGGGAQSSKDYTKVDRSGLYAARWIAKNIVANGIAKKCSVQLSYAIGIAKPISVNVDTFGTSNISDDVLSNYVKSKYELSPKWIIDRFHLDNPVEFNYADVAARGQVGQDDYPWEQIDSKTFRAVLDYKNKIKIFFQNECSKILFEKRDHNLENKIKKIVKNTINEAIKLGIYTDDYYKATSEVPLAIPDVTYSCIYENDISKPFFIELNLANNIKLKINE